MPFDLHENLQGICFTLSYSMEEIQEKVVVTCKSPISQKLCLRDEVTLEH